jgi:isocitrate dehydrogenase
LCARAKIDQNEDLMDFADTLEKVTIETVMRNCMTQDLATLVNNNLNTVYNENDDKVEYLSTQDFINEIEENLKEQIKK